MSTTATSERPTPSPLTLAEATALRADLADWTVDAVASVLGERATAALTREQILPALRQARAAGDEPIAVLTRLLMLGDTVTRAQADAALRAVGVVGAQRVGLIEAAGEGADDAVRSLVDVRPYAAADGAVEHTWWVASDVSEAVTGRQLADDHVLGIGGASTTLASATIRRPVGRVLDLGTGSGIQALHASTHAREVVATDISTRALGFAAFNRDLNQPRAPWQLRQGSLLEPVAGEQFDLVVSNPPFVISPANAPHFEYRDGGLGGDGIVATLITTLGAVLTVGGTAQMLGNWEIRHGDGWTHRLEQWLAAAAAAGHHLDAWIIQRDVLDTAEYAETWLRDAGVTPQRDRAGFEAAYAAYLDDFDSRGVSAVGFGMVLLRRSGSGPTLRRLEEHAGMLPTPLGPHLGAALDAHDWLARHDDDAVLAQRWHVASDVTQESYGRPGQEHPQHVLLRQGGALGRSIKADTALAGFVGASDGELTGAQIAAALAALLEVPVEQMRSGLALAVRELVMDGLLYREGTRPSV